MLMTIQAILMALCSSFLFLTSTRCLAHPEPVNLCSSESSQTRLNSEIMAFVSTEETKEGVNDNESPHRVSNLEGHWKMLMFINGTKYWGTHDIEVTRHSSQGVVEAELVGTSNPEKSYTAYPSRSKYVGVVRGDQVTLTYQDATNHKYTASLILKITDYAMDGTWNDSSKQFGTCQWLKLCHLKPVIDNNNQHTMPSIPVQNVQQRVDVLTAELNALKQQMTWRVWRGNAFDPSKEYRVRMNQGGGYYAVEWVGTRELFFGCSTANHYYGCIEASNPTKWHYRFKGNSATKVPNGDNGNVFCIEERG